MGYKSPTPIQEQAIPKILEGSDLIASAQTGTGKTAAFMLPVLHMLATQPLKKGAPHILVLVPTRELAIQVADVVKKFSKHLQQVKTVCVYGGVPYPIQRRALASHYDILVATPGRLIDHMEQGRINLSKIKLFILDEADRMLDMGFIEPVEQIAAAMPKERQTLLFSATIDNKILPISRKLQNNPFQICIEPTATKNNIEHRLFFVDNIGHKNRLLDHLLEQGDINQTIVFTATKSQADDLARDLHEKGHEAGALHGDMSQRQRTRTIEKMRAKRIRVLSATDVAARGIDIASLSHVINFDLPHNPEDFIHRIGRTGRAGASGIAITFASQRDRHIISRINNLLETPMAVHTIPGLEPTSKGGDSRPRPGPGGRHNQRFSPNNSRRPQRQNEFGKRSGGEFNKRSNGDFGKRPSGEFSKRPGKRKSNAFNRDY